MILTKQMNRFLLGEIQEEKLLVDPCFKPESGNKSQTFKLAVARRLVRLWKNRPKSCTDENGDLLMALRDYLLVFKTTIPCQAISIQTNSFGIHQIGNEEYAADFNIDPDEIPRNFLADIFDGKPAEHVPESLKLNLLTNPYIYHLTGYEFFKSPAQKIAVSGALKAPAGSTTLISLPTSGGKSLITQTLAYIAGKTGQKKLTIVVVPTVALAYDQERAAKAVIKDPNIQTEVMAYVSGDSERSIETVAERIYSNQLRLLFTSPEALIRNQILREALLDQANSIHNIVVDEAHLIVEWGDKFRLDFQALQVWRNELMSRNAKIRTYLLSATLENRMVNTLKILMSTPEEDNWFEIRCDSLRKEPRYCIVNSKNQAAKQGRFIHFVRNLPHPMIVYFDTPEEAEAAGELLEENGISGFAVFTGHTDNLKRARLISQWIDDQFPIMLATKAFGVGMDKPDVRTVLHNNIPGSISDYYQELGRGGRDGLASLSVMNISLRSDRFFPESIPNKRVLTEENMIRRWTKMFFDTSELVNNHNYYIDTAVIPAAADAIDDEESYETLINRQGAVGHARWNTVLLFLMQRHNLIRIHSFQYDESIFEFEIEILDDRLRESALLENVFTKVREDELGRMRKEIRQFIRSIQNAVDGKNMCHGEMFSAIYPLTSLYCAGCGDHTHSYREERTERTLKKNLIKPITSDSLVQNAHLFKTSRERIVLGSEETWFKFLNKVGLDLVITSKQIDRQKLLNKLQSGNFMVLSFEDLPAVQKERYLVSGTIVLLYSDNQKDVNKEYEIIRRYFGSDELEYNQIALIHCISRNFQIASAQKGMTDLIEGPVSVKEIN